MQRGASFGCVAVLGGLLLLTTDANTQPKPKQGSDIYVIMKARLFEVDEAFHHKVAKARWRSLADLEELERPGAFAPPDGALFTLLEKQKPVLAGKEVNIDPGKEGVLLTATKSVNYLPTPEQLRQGKNDPQRIDESFTLS